MKTVSIIIPMYNVARFLETCVMSVLDQEIDHTELEVLMIDDGSPDESREVAGQLAEKYAFIKVFSQKNKGLGGARNTGMEHATGKYIVFLDADDILLPKSLSKLIVLAENHNLDILEFGAQLIDEEGNVLSTVSKDSDAAVYTGIEYYAKIKYMNSACNKLYSTQFINDHDLQFTEKIYREDFEFNTRSFFHAKRIMATKVLGASFLQSSNSITRNKNKKAKDKYIEDYTKSLQLIEDFRNSQTLDKDNSATSKYFDERMAVSNLGLFYYMFKNNYSFKAMSEKRKELKKDSLYLDSFKVSEGRFEKFRVVMLKNFYLFSLTQPLKKALSL
ncbi:MAG: glycosyltransferase [Leeuwenhoekiella sp.]